MDFFNSPFWGFGQFFLAAIDFVRSLRRSSPPEATNQQKPIKEPVVEITTEGRFFALIVVSAIAFANLYVFLLRVFAAGVSFNTNILPLVVFFCIWFLDALIVFYRKVLFGIFICLHFCATCTFTVLVAWALTFGTPTYHFFLLLDDLQMRNVTATLITFLIIYLTTFMLMFPGYRIYRKANGTPKQKTKKQNHEPPLQQH